MGWFSKKKPGSASGSPDGGAGEDQQESKALIGKKAVPGKEEALIATTSGKTEELLATTSKEIKPLELQSRITFETAEREDYLDLPAAQQGRYTIALNEGRRIVVFDEKGQKDEFFSEKQSNAYTQGGAEWGNCDQRAHVWGSYVIFLNTQKKLFVALKTASDDGVILAPRNWTRISSADNGLPSDLSQHVRELLEKHSPANTTNKKLGTDYRVSVDEKAIKVKGADKQEAWRDNVPGIDKNFCVDPTNANVLYYCQQRNPREMHRLDISGGRPPWHAQLIPFPQPTNYIDNLEIHPTGAFFICSMGNSARHVLRCDTLEEVPCPELNASQNVVMGEDGNFFCMKDQKLIRLETNLNDLARSFLSQRRSQALQGLSAQTILQKVKAPSVAVKPSQVTQDMSAFQAQKTQFSAEFGQLITATQSATDLQPIRIALDELRRELRARGLQQAEISFITDDIDKAIITKNRQIADADVTRLLSGVRNDLAKIGSLSLPVVTGMKDRLRIDEAIKQILSPTILHEVDLVAGQVDVQLHNLLESQELVFIQQIDEMIAGEKRKLESMTKPSLFEDWMDKELPSRQRWLSSLVTLSSNPPPKVLERITGARGELQGLCDRFDEKFRGELDKVRESASAFSDKTATFLKSEIGRFIDRLGRRNFRNRDDAIAFLRDNDARKELELQIDAFANNNESESQHLRLTMQIQIENFLYEVNRRAQVKEGPDGKMMEPFGKTLFPRFEGEVRERGERRTELTFALDDRSRGAGISADKLMGDVAMRVTTGDGHELKMRLWEKNLGDLSANSAEDDMRLGLQSHRGQEIAPSYRSQKEFLILKKLYARWRNNGELRQEHDRLRKDLKDYYARRERPNKGVEKTPRSVADAQWQEKYRELLTTFADFCAKNQVTLLQRMEDIENAKDPEYQNGKGFIPEWRNNWVVAPEDDALLEDMAIKFKKQLDPDIQQGALLLKGHPGTGKDVALRIFAARTRRPFFPFDCSRQTSEFDLSQDIALDERDGASVTVKEDSIVLRALETPGAILYFNEFNNMTEPVQIFLNGLLAEPRAVALKTSSGRVVKAHPSVLIAASMNPNYKGTNPLASSTRDRLDEIEVGYAPLRQSKDQNKPQPSDPFSASEALKIARIVKSLKNTTLAPEMDRNEFVKAWNGHVNKIGESPKLTQAQRFDMDVILGLVQFAEKLRVQYLKGFEKNGKAAFDVKHPVTLRTLVSCGYALGLMTDEEKISKNAGDTARMLMKGCLLQHIDSATEKEKISTAMDQWTIEPRVL